MAKFSSTLVFALLVSLVSGFAPRQPTNLPKQTTSSQLEAAPTMVVYWTIKSAIDYVGYAAGQTDEWKGTGVWSGLSASRDKDGEDGDDESSKQKKDSN